MIWNDVQKTMNRWGCLVYAMDQGQTNMMKQPGPWGKVHKGYCSGLAQRWIALRYEGKDYPYDEATKECEMPDWQAARDQNLLGPGDDLTAALNAAMSEYDISVKAGSKTSQQGPATGAMLSKAAADMGCYYIVLVGTEVAPAQAQEDERKGESAPAVEKETAIGHALALQRELDGFRLFDANHGHFHVKGKGPEFEFIFGHYMNLTGYKTTFLTRAELVGINPPRLTNLSMESDSPPVQRRSRNK